MPQLRIVARKRLGAQRVWFERQVKHIIRRPDIQKAVLVWEEPKGIAGMIHLNGDTRWYEIMNMLERAKLEMFFNHRKE